MSLESVVFEGTVREGVIVLAEEVRIPEGTRVQVRLIPTAADQPTLLSLLKLAGIAKDLPADFAAQHDHYLHGTPKR